MESTADYNMISVVCIAFLKPFGTAKLTPPCFYYLLRAYMRCDADFTAIYKLSGIEV